MTAPSLGLGLGPGPGTASRPLRVAVVGAGPAGFYAAEALIKQPELVTHVDLFERLPAPYGLVRYGVAPDHQKIKSVTAAYDRVLQHANVRLLGNVHVGHDVPVSVLAEHYDAVVLAVGCETDRRLGIPGEDLAGSHAATSFVGWYNGHPDFHDYPVDLGVERAAVVGVGDVAMDLARLLLKSPDDLAGTDIATGALDVFRQNRVREVVVLARRGPAQAAFATKELEDIAELPDVDVEVDRAHVRADLEHAAELDGLARRKLEYLATLAERTRTGAARRLVFRFLTSPVEILGSESGSRVTGIRIEHNELSRDAKGNASARGTGRFETIPVGLVFRSVGYRGVPIPGVPFDERSGIVPNRDGRVLQGSEIWPGAYVAGWIKRGPSGVIGTNKSDAAATVKLLIEDARSGPARDLPPRDAILDVLRKAGLRLVDRAGWQRLDALERERGKAVAKVRDKLVTVQEMLAALGDASA